MLTIPLIYFNLFIFINLLFSAGVGRTGVFIALTNLIERVKTEGVVDVYQTVKKMRQQRTAMVQTRVSFYWNDCFICLVNQGTFFSSSMLTIISSC